ncbi:serine hydrolase domain-containing protein [Labedaea rhizosphaerae]|uniref:CubicO group peptidase (Beta-lactamase class C family) n=1 Tax=Labedaea rhizosphaerae TaxID=598644 RepID=A0A4R6S0D2_LABRH|nr:serine hydrolase domain-containing protein [Labedaea rhizosphaerae]TDP92900.1 CubicO group peptidase (beta-lactamase class C family) [Labedaea rhizosphaerae]
MPTVPTVDTRDATAVLQEFRAATGVTGVSASLFDATGIVAEVACGVASIERPHEPMTPRTVGLVYSLSKVMTGTAFAVLAARDRVDLDEPISSYLPDATGKDRFETTSIRHLLTHTSGLVGGPVPFTTAVLSADPLEQYALGACLGAPRFGEPGEVFGYSDTGIVLAGYLLQRITGKPFADAMRETLFEPAGMTRSTMDPLVAMSYPLSQQHVRTKAGAWTVRRRFDGRPMTAPSTGAFSTTGDLARLGIVHLRGGDRPLLTEQAAAQAHTRYVDVGLDITRDFGLAIAIGPRHGDDLGVGHEGHHEGGWVKLLFLPGLGVGVAWLDNHGDDPAITPVRQQHFDRLLALLGAGPRSWRREGESTVCPDLSAVAGTYRRPAGRPIRISLLPNGLRATDGVHTIDYTHLADRIFVAPGEIAPNRIPWAPDPDSTRSALCVVGPVPRPTHILVNGLPYRRDHHGS